MQRVSQEVTNDVCESAVPTGMSSAVNETNTEKVVEAPNDSAFDHMTHTQIITRETRDKRRT